MSQVQSLNQRALETIKQLRQRIAEFESARPEPIAIVGMGCRLPSNVCSPDELWQALLEGRDLLEEIPQVRWDMSRLYDPDPDAPGRMNSPRAGLISDLAEFDAELFEFSPREAARLDPQQRLLLETTWRALEDAGLSPTALRGSRTGVFVGIATQDYLQLQTVDPTDADAHTATGCDAGFASGRLAFYFDWHGPSLSLNTLCSSSLVAVHQACASLRARDADCAVAAGVNALLWPTQSIIAAKFRALSSSGACKTFDAAADGFVRSEGCGVVILKRLSDAKRDGDRIVALIRGSATNHDGRGLGLTAPNGWAQCDVMRKALAASGLEARDVGFVEAHGSATQLGDPIEVDSVVEVYGQGNAPCALGALKSNLGHLEAAAGIVGLIKAALCVERGVVPPNIHFQTINPRIEIEGTRFFIPKECVSWEDAQRNAVVSAFGLSGTNAHVVLSRSEPPLEAPHAAPEGTPYVYRLHAKSAAALRRQARVDAEFLSGSGAPLAAICDAVGRRRAAFEHRAYCVGTCAADVAQELARFAETGLAGPNLYPGHSSAVPRLGFLFTGQGSQYLGMARPLYARYERFRATLDRCESVFVQSRGSSLLDVMWGRGMHAELLDQTRYTQPALYALGCGLVDLLRCWGVQPACVLGHSVGEFAAAYAAGVLDLEVGLELVARRAELMQSLPAGSGMLSAVASRAELERVLGLGLLGAEMVAFNGPNAIVLGGTNACLTKCAGELKDANIASQLLEVSHAFHSRQMEPILEPFRRAFDRVSLSPPRIEMISSALGSVVQGQQIVASDYWVTQIRRPVEFEAALQTASRASVAHWIELGPRAILSQLAARAVPSVGKVCVPTLRGSGAEERELLSTAAQLGAAGMKLDWTAIEVAQPSRHISLPVYQFERLTHWHEAARAQPKEASSSCYSVVWQRSEPSVSSNAERPAYIFLGHSAAAQPFVAQLQTSGVSARSLGLDFSVDDLLALLEEMDAPDCLVILVASPGANSSPGEQPSPKESLEREASWCDAALKATRALQSASRARTRLGVVTRNVQFVGETDAVPTDVCGASLWGLVQSLALELPHHWAGIIDAPRDAPPQSHWLQDLGGEESEIAWRCDQRYVRRLVETTLPHPSPELDIQGSYLITGGTGGLGMEVAGLLLRRGATRVVLMSRSGQRAGDSEQFDRLRSLGGELDIVAGDVTNAADLGRAIARAQADGVPLRGVVHAAGVASRRAALSLTKEDLLETLAPKVWGSELLTTILSTSKLDFLVLFSSIAGVWGAPELAHYAAANAYLDAVARKLRGAVKSIQWGPWLARGLMDAEQARDFERVGLRTLSVDTALAALQDNFSGSTFEVVVAAVELSRLADAQRSRARRPLFENVAPAPRSREVVGRTDEPRATLPANYSVRELEALIAAELSSVLGLTAAAAADVERGFFDIGLDSIMGVELRRRLELRLGMALLPTVFIDSPNVRALSQALVATARTEQAPARALSRSSDSNPAVAIVGLACRFPNADSVEELWQLLLDGVDATSEVPVGRWPSASESWAHAGTRPRGGFLKDVTGFDPEFFGIATKEARNMDPQQRLLLEVAWEVLENAGWDPRQLRNSNTGVYAGVGTGDHALGGVAGFDAAYFGSGNAVSAIPGRVAYLLGLRGPAIAIDAACASSLVSVHLACEALRNAECDVAIAGGVNLMLSPEGHAALSAAKMTSADGRCKTFDARADGYARGEGCGLVALKRLTDAQRDGDQIVAVLLGSAINHNGSSGGMTVPSGGAQVDVIQAALSRAEVAASDVAYVEAHGTGTPLGDPVELQALAAAYGGERSQPLLTGSIKTNLGHLEAAAGIAGLIKVALCVQRGQIPRSLHFKEPNPRIDWSRSPVSVVDQNTAWPSPGTRYGGVSSFGFTGTNAHLIVASGPVVEVQAPTTARQIVKISARSEAALWASVRRLSRAVHTSTASLADIAFTANTGRSDQRFRLCVVASDLIQLRQQLSVAASFGLVDQRTSFYGHEQRSELVFDLREALPESLLVSLLREGEALSAHARDSIALVEAATGYNYRTLLTERLPNSEDRSGVLTYLASCLLVDLLRDLGLQPSIVYCVDPDAALVSYAGGAISFEEGLQLVLGRAVAARTPGLGGALIVQEKQSPIAVGSVVVCFHASTQTTTEASSSRSPTGWHCVGFERGIANALARLYTLGFDVQWSALYPQGKFRRVALSTSPFERRTLWNKVTQPAAVTPSLRALGVRISTGSADALYRLEVSAMRHSFLRDHRVFGDLIVPGTYHVALGLSALLDAGKAAVLNDVTFVSPLRLFENQSRAAEVQLDGDQVQIRSLDSDDEPWTVHLTAVAGTAAESPEAIEPLSRASLSEARSALEFYSLIGERELLLGPAFSWVRRIWSSPGEALAELREPTPLEAAQAQEFAIFPGLLDSALQCLAATVAVDVEDVVIPVGARRIELHGDPGPQPSFVRVRLEPGEEKAREYSGSLRLCRADGNCVLSVDGLTVRRVERETFRRSGSGAATSLLADVGWRRLTLPAQPAIPRPVEIVILSAPLDERGEHLKQALSDLPAESPIRVRRCVQCSSFAAVDAHIKAIPAEARASVEVIWVLPGAEHSREPTETRELLEQSFEELRTLMTGLQLHAARLWVFGTAALICKTADAHAVSFSGALRSLLHEGREVFAGMFEASVDPRRLPVRDALAALLASGSTGEYRLTNEGAWSPQLEPRRRSRSYEPLVIDPEEVMLVSGAGGALASSLLEWLHTRGARRFVLLGRSQSESASRALVRLDELGAEARWVSLDVGASGAKRSLEDLAHSLEQAPVSVFHLAGVVRDGVIERIELADLRETFAAKAIGAWNLHLGLASVNVRRFVQFSSLAAVAGNAGQAVYAASNAYLAWLSNLRREEGLPALTIHWGPWAGAGLFAGKSALGTVTPLLPTRALELLEDALQGRAECDPVAIDLGVSASRAAFAVSDLLKSRAAPSAQRIPFDWSQASGLSSTELLPIVERWLLKVVERVLGTDQLSRSLSLSDAGIDSLMAVEIRDTISTELELRVELAELLRGPSVRELAEGLSVDLSKVKHDESRGFDEGEI